MSYLLFEFGAHKMVVQLFFEKHSHKVQESLIYMGHTFGVPPSIGLYLHKQLYNEKRLSRSDMGLIYVTLAAPPLPPVKYRKSILAAEKEREGHSPLRKFTPQ